MTIIRCYDESDAPQVGILIAETYSRYNLSFVPPADLGLFLGPFRYAGSPDPAHREAIARVVRSALVFVAEDEGEIVGVLRGRKGRLGSLFVRGDHQRQGIGRRLVERFEPECTALGSGVIHVAATVYAIAFYQALGYKKSTGLRRGYSFEGHGLPVQPMRKVINP
jgi:GNAT superfamily N-acetyltransferase